MFFLPPAVQSTNHLSFIPHSLINSISFPSLFFSSIVKETKQAEMKEKCFTFLLNGVVVRRGPPAITNKFINFTSLFISFHSSTNFSCWMEERKGSGPRRRKEEIKFINYLRKEEWHWLLASLALPQRQSSPINSRLLISFSSAAWTQSFMNSTFHSLLSAKSTALPFLPSAPFN